MTWGGDDIRIIGDIVVASLLVSGARMIVLKAFIEPAAVTAGRWAYRRTDAAMGDRLPDLFPLPPKDEPNTQP